MCKRYTAEMMQTFIGELGINLTTYRRFNGWVLDNIEDLRVHADMFPTSPAKLYKACLAGTRRQKF